MSGAAKQPSGSDDGGAGLGYVEHQVGGGDAIDDAIQQSEMALAQAESTTDLREAERLTKRALLIRRKCCHPLSMLLYEAEAAACNVAMGCTDYAAACECSTNVVRFLSAVLAHLPWHPTLSMERYRLAGLETAIADAVKDREHRSKIAVEHIDRAIALLDRCLPALLITHGPEHPIARRAFQTRKRVRLYHDLSDAVGKVPQTDEMVLERDVLSEYTPDPSVARKDWVPFSILLRKLEAVRPQLSNRTAHSDAHYALTLVKAWCAGQPAFAGLDEAAYCLRLPDSSPGAKSGSKVWKFAFCCTPPGSAAQ